ncbi:sigma-70 family RNA polymerase sigma factor [candidate division KSB1 bacterium]|nr:sigma-70 family RNA polymerase sigma factor [candidate division KSB1 bacterium]
MQSEEKTEFVKRITENQGIIHKICNFYCYNAEDRQDLYQEITLQLWKSYPEFRSQSAFSTWMYRIALNTAITMTRKMNIFDTLAEHEQLLILQEESESVQELEEDIRILYKAIEKLNKIEKAIILLWLEEKSYDEVAEITGLSVKNVSVKLVRTKRKLAEIIKKLL